MTQNLWQNLISVTILWCIEFCHNLLRNPISITKFMTEFNFRHKLVTELYFRHKICDGITPSPLLWQSLTVTNFVTTLNRHKLVTECLFRHYLLTEFNSCHYFVTEMSSVTILYKKCVEKISDGNLILSLFSDETIFLSLFYEGTNFPSLFCDGIIFCFHHNFVTD